MGEMTDIAVVGLGAFIAYKFFDDNRSLTKEEQTDFSEQAERYDNQVFPKDKYPDSNWSYDFNYSEVQQSDLTPTDTLLRTTNEDGDLSSYKFNPNDLTAPQRRAFNLGLWDFEDGSMQFGLFEGLQRKMRGGLGEDSKLLIQTDNSETPEADNVVVNESTDSFFKSPFKWTADLFKKTPLYRDFFDSSSHIEPATESIDAAKHSQITLSTLKELGIKKDIAQAEAEKAAAEAYTHAQRRVVRDKIVVSPISQADRDRAADTANRYGSDAFKKLAAEVL